MTATTWARCYGCSNVNWYGFVLLQLSLVLTSSVKFLGLSYWHIDYQLPAILLQVKL